MKTSLFDRFADPGTQLTACIGALSGPTGSNRMIRTPGWAAAGKLHPPSHGLPPVLDDASIKNGQACSQARSS